jgi:YfiH family protein
MADAMTTPRFEGDPPTHFLSPLLESAGLPHLFTTRNFPGVTAFRDPFPPLGPDATPLLAECGLAAEPAGFLKQVHGADVLRATEGGCAGNADALMTDRPGLPIAVFSADCVPLLIYDPDGRRLAVAHAGWRGTAQSVARAAVLALAEAGGRPEEFLAAVGPSIGPCCYEVDKPVIGRLDAAFPGRWGAWVRSVGLGKWMLDLWAANEDQLRSAGIRGDRIDNPRLCTGCRTDLFYSYRRGHKGRLVSIAAVPLTPPQL